MMSSRRKAKPSSAPRASPSRTSKRRRSAPARGAFARATFTAPSPLRALEARETEAPRGSEVVEEHDEGAARDAVLESNPDVAVSVVVGQAAVGCDVHQAHADAAFGPSLDG